MINIKNYRNKIIIVCKYHIYYPSFTTVTGMGKKLVPKTPEKLEVNTLKLLLTSTHFTNLQSSSPKTPTAYSPSSCNCEP